MNRLYSIGGRLAKPFSWPHGKIRVVTAFNYKEFAPREYNYLKSLYPNMIDLYELDDILKGKPAHNRSRRWNLSDMTINDKLIIVGHSDETGFMDYSENEIANFLQEMRLKNVGVIKFHSCYLGKEDWLLSFKTQLERKGINFCYLSGVKGIYWYFPVRGARHYKIIAGKTHKNFPGTRYNINNVNHF